MSLRGLAIIVAIGMAGAPQAWGARLVRSTVVAAVDVPREGRYVRTDQGYRHEFALESGEFTIRFFEKMSKSLFESVLKEVRTPADLFRLYTFTNKYSEFLRLFLEGIDVGPLRADIHFMPEEIDSQGEGDHLYRLEIRDEQGLTAGCDPARLKYVQFAFYKTKELAAAWDAIRAGDETRIHPQAITELREIRTLRLGDVIATVEKSKPNANLRKLTLVQAGKAIAESDGIEITALVSSFLKLIPQAPAQDLPRLPGPTIGYEALQTDIMSFEGFLLDVEQHFIDRGLKARAEWVGTLRKRVRALRPQWWMKWAGGMRRLRWIAASASNMAELQQEFVRMKQHLNLMDDDGYRELWFDYLVRRGDYAHFMKTYGDQTATEVVRRLGAQLLSSSFFSWYETVFDKGEVGLRIDSSEVRVPFGVTGEAIKVLKATIVLEANGQSVERSFETEYVSKETDPKAALMDTFHEWHDEFVQAFERTVSEMDISPLMIPVPAAPESRAEQAPAAIQVRVAETDETKEEDEIPFDLDVECEEILETEAIRRRR